MKVAYHANYLVWFELGRTEFMRDLGCPYGDLEEQAGIGFPVIEAGVKFRAPALYDDRLVVWTELVRVEGVRVRFEYRIERETDERLLSTGFTEHATVGPQGRPMRLPDELRLKLESRSSRRDA
jgi:acyl-CoA thioester hydrolase